MITFDYASIPPAIRSRLAEYAKMACSTQQGLQHTYLATQHVLKHQVPGALVECGVAYGAQICAMAEAAREQPRPIHLFDSFCGIPLAGVNDQDQPGIGTFVADPKLPLRERLVSSGVSASSVDNVRRNLARYGFGDNCHYHVGWFQDTVPGSDTGPIALLRLDGDLYESTEVCLRHLFDRVSPGGAIVLDDYPLVGSRKAWEEFCKSRDLTIPPIVACDTGAAYFQL